MRSHLDALVLLQRLWGSFGLIAGASLATLAGGTAAALVQSGSLVGAALGLVWVLGFCALALAVGGLAALIAARGLQRRNPAGRAAALLLAFVDFLIVPFGTALGIYTLWVLLNDDARREFGRPLRGTPTATAR
jgi:hypothetical protein